MTMRTSTVAILSIALQLAIGTTIVALAGTTTPTSSLPNAFGDIKLTPGALNPLVTAANIDETICNKEPEPNGKTWVHNQRPADAYFEALKRKQLADPRYGYVDKNPAHYEEDHVCSIENGGWPGDPKHPNDPRNAANFRPEPYGCEAKGKHGKMVPCLPKNCLTTPGAKCKDLDENAEHKLICAHKMTPAQACAINAGDWLTNGYKVFVSNKR